MTATHEHQPGEVLDGKYRIERVLGRGGMGCVFEVLHLVTRHRRALKTLHVELRDRAEIVGRFLREASAAGRIGNPHIIETFDAGELRSGEPFLVMEFLEGETLSDKLERQGRLGVDETLELMVQATRGVVAAHQAGVVHRDLKPDNIFLASRDGRPFVKLLDFGISKFEALAGEKGITQDGATLGTPFYMAPEQMAGQARELDARADVYALGVVLYELLSGHKPYDGATIMELAVKVHAGGAPPLVTVRPELPTALSDTVARAMSTDKAQRPSSQELLSTLEALAGTRDLGAAAAQRAEPRHGADVELTATTVGAPPQVVVAASTNLDAGELAATPLASTMATPPKTRWPVWVGAAAVVALASTGLYVLRGAPTAGPDAAARPTAEPSAAATRGAPDAPPSVSVSAVPAAASTPVAAPAVPSGPTPATHGAPARVTASSAAAPPPATTTAAPAAPTKTTRSDKAGMATSPY